MRGFIKTFFVFIYLVLALFIQPSDTFACDNIRQNIPPQYYISVFNKSKIYLINNKNEEYYVISKNNNKTEVSNLSNKNQTYGSANFDEANVDFIIQYNFIIDNSIYSTCISHNISPNLKNAIYTRAP
ncbi:hypothetical protein J6G99_01490 [bacterium]|nr:hypothetical protein [bacterium]